MHAARGTNRNPAVQNQPLQIQISRGERRGVAERNLEIGRQRAGRVAEQRNIARRIKADAQLAETGEFSGADKGKGLIARQLRVGVDGDQVDLVAT
jgi:hypothetical protein